MRRRCFTLMPMLRLLATLAVCCVHAQTGRAYDPGDATPSDDSPVSSRQEILRATHDIQQKYGADAVMMEGHLLGHAIRGGSILAAAISVPGLEERSGKRFLIFKLDTGIIYNDAEVTAGQRGAHVWSDIVEATLRKFRMLTLNADGVAFLLGYNHKPYHDASDLRAHLSEAHGDTETAAFYLLLTDVTELLAERITGQQLIDRSVVLVNGAPVHITLDAPTPSPTPPAKHT